MPSFADGVDTGLFLPTTEIIDTGYIYDIDNFSADQLKQILIRIVQAFNDSNTTMNLKDSAIYSLQEFVNGQIFFPNPALSSTTAQTPQFRQVFRKVFNIGALPNAATKTVAHGIPSSATNTFTRIYGAASDVGLTKQYIPLPFVDVSGMVAAGNTELSLDDTNIYVTTTGNGTNFTVCYIILEYLKQ
jgi:hypothetical protein